MNPIPNMDTNHSTQFTAFEGFKRVAAGSLDQVATRTKAFMDNPDHGEVLVFDDLTSELIEIDFRGSPDEVLARLKAQASDTTGTTSHEPAEKRGPGRPRLGVTGREVTLLPRHWEWLDAQPGGASVALRKLVESAKRASPAKDRARQSQEAVHRFMCAVAGNLPGFEEALRAFYRGNKARLDEVIAAWPVDVRDHIEKLVARAKQNLERA